MQAFEVVGQTNECPLARSGKQTAQRELTKTQDLFDNANHRLNRAFAEAIDFTPHCRLEFVGHLDFRRGIVGRWLTLLGEKALPTLMMGLPTSGNVRLDSVPFTGLCISRAEEAVIQKCVALLVATRLTRADCELATISCS